MTATAEQSALSLLRASSAEAYEDLRNASQPLEVSDLVALNHISFAIGSVCLDFELGEEPAVETVVEYSVEVTGRWRGAEELHIAAEVVETTCYALLGDSDALEHLPSEIFIFTVFMLAGSHLARHGGTPEELLNEARSILG